MKWFALLFLGVFGEGAIAQECNSTQEVDPSLINNQFTIGQSAVRPLNIRNTADAAEEFKESFIQARAKYGAAIRSTDDSQITGIGEDLIAVIENDCAKLHEAIDDTPNRLIRSDRINNHLIHINRRLEKFLELKPGNQKIKSEFGKLPPVPKFKSNWKNLTAADVFLHLTKIKDDELAARNAYTDAIYWHGWKIARRNALPLLQIQYRNQVLNNRVLPVYRRIVDDVYSSDIRNCVDEETWDIFVAARTSIDKLSDAYIKSVEECE